MKTEITTFLNNELSVSIRAGLINNEPYFVGKDITEGLDYKNHSRDIQRHVDPEDKLLINKKSTETVLSGIEVPARGLLVINESGVYSLILRSNKETAKQFKRWVTSEVLPSIRKNGGYIANQENKSPEQILADALIVAQNIIVEREKALEQKTTMLNVANTIIQDKNYPMSLTKLLGGGNKVTQAANLYLCDEGYIVKTFEKGKVKGWCLTDKGEALGFGCQHSEHSIFWTADVLKLLPKTSELLDYAERLNLKDHKSS